MSLEKLMNIAAVVLLRAPEPGSGDDVVRDVLNNPVLEDVEVATFIYFEQRVRSEDTVNTESESEEFLVLLPLVGELVGAGSGDTELVDLGADLDGISAVRARGMTLELIGPPWRVENPRRRAVSHLEARAKRVV